MFDFLLILIFSKRVLFENIQSLNYIHRSNYNSTIYLFDITITITDDQIEINNVCYHHDFNCLPMENCLPSEPLLNQMARFWRKSQLLQKK